MMQSCPHCGSTDIVAVELSEAERNCLYECEECEEQFNGDEFV